MGNERKLRLIQVAKEFNLGLSTITNFLQKKGIAYDNSPNALVDPEAYAALKEEFGQKREAVGARDAIREYTSPKPSASGAGSDVFISYSRRDTAVADRICAAFDRAGIAYFIDRQGIGGGQEFPDVLAQAIVDCKIVLFLAGRNSYASKFTNGEITFAFNKRKSILPFCIDDCEMPLGLQLMCSGINWRDIREHSIEGVLVSDILHMLGRAPQPAAAPVAAPARLRTYAVGDYYNENGREGIVFEVDATGRHGKIMALRDLPEKLAWCTRAEYDGKRVGDGATDRTDGMKNLQAIRRIPRWQEKYPAFAGCVALGEGWYLPALEELKKIYGERKRLSEKAEQFGGLRLKDEADGGYEECWSSSEGGSPNLAWYVHFVSDYLGVYGKYVPLRVRPVAAF